MLTKSIRFETKPVCASAPECQVTWKVYRWKLWGVTIWRYSNLASVQWMSQ